MRVPQCVLFLEKELVALGGMCAASLLKEETILPFAGKSRPASCCATTMLWCHTSVRIIHTFTEELNATDQKTDNEKADMRIVQAAAQEVTAS